ncbi:MAG TPA: CopG family transcriptional regulator [Acidimicrobiales bacterium]|nr:CopG family transcriptional regulator [Acidimicrobiales bacterium]
MKRTTVLLPDDVDGRLRLEARRRHVPIADLVREAIDRYLPEIAPAAPPGFFGVGEGSPEDASERVDELVGEAVARRRKVEGTERTRRSA